MRDKVGEYKTRVRFAETDLQGVVFYGNYFTYQDETFYEYLRQIGYPNEQLQANDWDVHVVHVSMDFIGSAVFEDIIINKMCITSIGESSITAKYAAYSQDGNKITTGEVVYVAVGPDSETTPVPDEFRSAVKEYQGGEILGSDV